MYVGWGSWWRPGVAGAQQGRNGQLFRHWVSRKGGEVGKEVMKKFHNPHLRLTVAGQDNEYSWRDTLVVRYSIRLTVYMLIFDIQFLNKQSVVSSKNKTKRWNNYLITNSGCISSGQPEMFPT